MASDYSSFVGAINGLETRISSVMCRPNFTYQIEIALFISWLIYIPPRPAGHSSKESKDDK
jgi:hypothetical protein